MLSVLCLTIVPDMTRKAIHCSNQHAIIFVLTLDSVGCWSRKLGNLSRLPGHPTPSLAGSPRLDWCDLDSRKDCPGTALCSAHHPPLPVKQRIFGRGRFQSTATPYRPAGKIITQGLTNGLAEPCTHAHIMPMCMRDRCRVCRPFQEPVHRVSSCPCPGSPE